MLLSYETSSLSYDDADLLCGKFVPAFPSVPAHFDRTTSLPLIYPSVTPIVGEGNKLLPVVSPEYIHHFPIRIFINVYGVFGDLSGRFAAKYDGLRIPHHQRVAGILDPVYVLENIPKSGVSAIMEEEFFWKNLEPYPWYLLIMNEIYKLCGGEYFLNISLYDSLQLEDRVIWLWRHFGEKSKPRVYVCNREALNMLVRSRNDVLIDANLRSVETWCEAGGSGFWWPEMDGKYNKAAYILSKRIRLLSQAVQDLKDLAKK